MVGLCSSLESGLRRTLLLSCPRSQKLFWGLVTSWACLFTGFQTNKSKSSSGALSRASLDPSFSLLLAHGRWMTFSELPFHGMQGHWQTESHTLAFWNGWEGNLIHSLSGMFSHISGVERRAKWFGTLCLPVAGANVSQPPHPFTAALCLLFLLLSPSVPLWLSFPVCVCVSVSECLCVAAPCVLCPWPSAAEKEDGCLKSSSWKLWHFSPRPAAYNFGTLTTWHVLLSKVSVELFI